MVKQIVFLEGCDEWREQEASDPQGNLGLKEAERRKSGEDAATERGIDEEGVFREETGNERDKTPKEESKREEGTCGEHGLFTLTEAADKRYEYLDQTCKGTPLRLPALLSSKTNLLHLHYI
jgi:hypothetical protein